MAKAVVPLDNFRQKYGPLQGIQIANKIGDLAAEFLHELVKV